MLVVLSVFTKKCGVPLSLSDRVGIDYQTSGHIARITAIIIKMIILNTEMDVEKGRSSGLLQKTRIFCASVLYITTISPHACRLLRLEVSSRFKRLSDFAAMFYFGSVGYMAGIS